MISLFVHRVTYSSRSFILCSPILRQTTYLLRANLFAPATYCAHQKSHSYRPLPNYSVGGIHIPTHIRSCTHAQTCGVCDDEAHATGTHECLMPADSDFHPRRESAPPTSSRFRSIRPVHPFCRQMGFSRPHLALTYSPRCRT